MIFSKLILCWDKNSLFSILKSLYLKDTSIYSKLTVRIDEKREERKEISSRIAK
jgi:hypothetical protein